MQKWEATITFDYYGKVRTVTGEFYTTGGTPTFSFRDRQGHYHAFQRVFGGWKSTLNVEPDWPLLFIDALYACIEIKFRHLYNSIQDFKLCLIEQKFYDG